MKVTHWNRRRVLIAAVGLTVFCWLFTASHHTHEDFVTIKNTKAKEIWEYVADFQNMQILNPTILEFRITADEGNYDHWRYSAAYTERLSHWPYWLNGATADFVVSKLHNNDFGQFTVRSNHRTCFFLGLYCLYSKGEFYFAVAGADTHVTEVVNYECPPFLGLMCKREVAYQRKHIMRNLKQHFNPSQ